MGEMRWVSQALQVHPCLSFLFQASSILIHIIMGQVGSFRRWYFYCDVYLWYDDTPTHNRYIQYSILCHHNLSLETTVCIIILLLVLVLASSLYITIFMKEQRRDGVYMQQNYQQPQVGHTLLLGVHSVYFEYGCGKINAVCVYDEMYIIMSIGKKLKFSHQQQQQQLFSQ